ncbi:EutN/CcmL family microcompartment protein [Paenibacillus athensensis]|uniref:Ethanolamine utilization protein EutN n=1 Tax=Paenibacillus athensensis TaxID=1967502 RepID=A0A4Y8PZ56_9BACL|nr:EutN/CcmL family microcompartment protein [Paenibacillus athensensis]MCD1260462.1 EutN/CcmL family microcompartment protein [Paenibacillus athensensis]
MFLGQVIGSVVCTQKDESLTGLKLLVVQPMKNAATPAGKPLVAIDTIGCAGYGDLVYLAKSREAGLPLGLELVAADAGIMGIVDNYNATT